MRIDRLEIENFKKFVRQPFVLHLNSLFLWVKMGQARRLYWTR
jgi:hypothetical protein